MFQVCEVQSSVTHVKFVDSMFININSGQIADVWRGKTLTIK